MIWVAPPPSHRIRRKLWEITHWRRVRRFKAYLRERIREDFERRLSETEFIWTHPSYDDWPTP